MISSEKILEMLNNGNYEELKELCKRDMVSKSLKANGGTNANKQLKAFEKFLKLSQKQPKELERIVHFDMVKGDEAKALCKEGLSALFIIPSCPFYKNIESVPMTGQVKLGSIADSMNTKFDFTIENAVIDFAMKYAKTNTADKRFRNLYLPNGALFDIELIKEVVNVLGDCEVYGVDNGNRTLISPILLQSNNGYALVCPRKNTEQDKEKCKTYDDYKNMME